MQKREMDYLDGLEREKWGPKAQKWLKEDMKEEERPSLPKPKWKKSDLDWIPKG